MKRIFYLTALTAMAMMVFSCKQEDPFEPNDAPEEQTETPGEENPEQPAGPDAEGNIVFNAVREDLGGDTKSTIASGGAVSWESGDAISILWDGGRTTSTTTDSGASASFSAEVDATASGGTYYSVYPSSVATELTAADVLSVTVPSNQDGTFSSANINVAKTTSTALAFKAIGNVIKFSVTDSDVTKVRIYSWDKSPLAGTCSVDVSGSAPAVSNYTSTSNEIVVTVDGAGTYYAVVLPGAHAEGLLFAPETASDYKRAAYAEKSWTATRKAITDFGAIQSHARDLYVSASGSGKGLSSADPMSPSAFTGLLEQPLDGTSIQDDDKAVRQFRLLYGSTITVQDDIAIDEIRVEYVGSFSKPCAYTIVGATQATVITASGTNRLFRFSNNTNVTFSGITLSGGSASASETASENNGGAIEVAPGNNGEATVRCNNVIFESNTASNNGGAVSVNGNAKAASFIASGCVFSANSATQSGGALYQSASSDANSANSVCDFTNCTFSGNTASAHGGVMQIYRGTANFSGTNTFSGNSAATHGGVFYMNSAHAVLNIVGDGSFGVSSSGNTSKNGGFATINSGATANISLDNMAEFRGNEVTGAGGAFYVANNSSLSVTGATFVSNVALKSATAQSGVTTASGGAVCAASGSVVSFNNCLFRFNRAGNTTSTYSYGLGGALCINGATVEAKECNFVKNKGWSGSAVFMLQNGGGLFKADKCAFQQNTQKTRGVCYVHDKNVAMFNQCSFYGQTMAAGESVYGLWIQGQTAMLCINNSSFYFNGSLGYTTSGINSNGPQLITNSSVIGGFNASGHGAVRTGVSTSKVYVNNVIINTETDLPSIQAKDAADIVCSYNVIGAKTGNFTPDGSTNTTGASAGDFTWNAFSSDENALTLWKSWFTWNGASQGATVDSITGAYASFNVDASSYGGVLGSMSHVGNAFKAWLEEASPASYTVNQQGAARAASYWPGSYQN